ncbi:MAG TPA: hypothetical protein VIP46_01310 [Pyrinomonadaceae bacterium]
MRKILSSLPGLLLCLWLASAGAAAQSRGEIGFIGFGGGGTTGGPDILLAAADGSSVTNVTNGRLSGIAAFAWSPDGSQFVVSADRGGNLYVVSADGNAVRRLTQNTGFAIAQSPTWSPDGRRIAYVGNAEQNYDVYVVNADGTGAAARLTNTRGIYRDLAWSPDGTRLAYASGPDFFNTHIFVMRADGSAPARVSAGGGSHTAPAWSPDGRRIAYQNDREFGPPEIFVVNADDPFTVRLTNNFASDRHPTWSPDGDEIAFVSNRDSVGSGGQSSAVYVASALDGSNPRRVTEVSLSAQSPAWRPPQNLAPAPGVPVLLTEQGTGRALALDSVTLMRDPLPVDSDYNFSADRRTRVLLFVGNLDAAALEAGLTFEVRFVDAQQQTLTVAPEGVRAVPNLPGVAQLTVRVPDALAASGDARVSVVAAGGAASNGAALRLYTGGSSKK